MAGVHVAHDWRNGATGTCKRPCAGDDAAAPRRARTASGPLLPARHERPWAAMRKPGGSNRPP